MSRLGDRIARVRHALTYRPDRRSWVDAADLPARYPTDRQRDVVSESSETPTDPDNPRLSAIERDAYARELDNRADSLEFNAQLAARRGSGALAKELSQRAVRAREAAQDMTREAGRYWASYHLGERSRDEATHRAEVEHVRDHLDMSGWSDDALHSATRYALAGTERDAAQAEIARRRRELLDRLESTIEDATEEDR